MATEQEKPNPFSESLSGSVANDNPSKGTLLFKQVRQEHRSSLFGNRTTIHRAYSRHNLHETVNILRNINSMDSPNQGSGISTPATQTLGALNPFPAPGAKPSPEMNTREGWSLRMRRGSFFTSQENISKILKSAGKRQKITLHVCVYFWLFLGLAEAGLISLSAALAIAIKDPGNTTGTLVWVILSIADVLISIIVAMVLRVQFFQGGKHLENQAQSSFELGTRNGNIRGESNSSGGSDARPRTPISVLSNGGQGMSKDALKRHKNQLESALRDLEARINGTIMDSEHFASSPVQETDLGSYRLSVLHEGEYKTGSDDQPYGARDASSTTLANHSTATHTSHFINKSSSFTVSPSSTCEFPPRSDSLIGSPCDPLRNSVPFHGIPQSGRSPVILHPASESLQSNAQNPQVPGRNSPAFSLRSSRSLPGRPVLRSKLSQTLEPSVLRDREEEDCRIYFERRREEQRLRVRSSARSLGSGEKEWGPCEEIVDDKIGSKRDASPYGGEVVTMAGEDASSIAEMYREEIRSLDGGL